MTACDVGKIYRYCTMIEGATHNFAPIVWITAEESPLTSRGRSLSNAKKGMSLPTRQGHRITTISVSYARITKA